MRLYKLSVIFFCFSLILGDFTFYLSPKFTGVALAADRQGPREPKPQPSPQPAPQPAPQPQPTPQPGPQPNLSAARQAGNQDGLNDGAREGDERGPQEGNQVGRKEGYDRGFFQCQEQRRKEEHDRGYNDGYRRGDDEGYREGDAHGYNDGNQKGNSDGINDGQNRANNDAYNAATPQGQAKGIDQANNSDASQRGAQDGTARGDQDAHTQALAKDYPAGRAQYRQSRLDEEVQNRDQFSQLGQTVAAKTLNVQGLLPQTQMAGRGENVGVTGGNASPDRRHYNPRPSFSMSEEVAAYKDAYDSAYDTGFRNAYSSSYNNAYRQAFNDSSNQGCNEARNRDYRDDYNEGRHQGRDAGYRAGYDRAYRRAYDATYAVAFRSASDNAYQQSYQSYYEQHFEAARAAAYSERVNQLYNAAFASARDEKYNEVYPTYAQQEFARGQSDEAQDFADRPVRLQSAEATETIVNGIFEPGEPLHVKVDMRNFAASSLQGKDIRVQIAALDSTSAVISQAEAILRKNIQQKSITTVTDALDFRMSEASVGQINQFRVTLLYQGKNCGETIIRVQTQWLLDLSFAEQPQLLEGLQSVIKLKVHNSGNIALPSNAQIALRSDPAIMQVLTTTATVGALAPGADQVLEYQVIARENGASIRVPFVFDATLNLGQRRVGLMDRTQEVPLINDYKIWITGQPATLKTTPGITRITYTISNENSRLTHKSLQLQVAVRTNNAQDKDNIVVIGPNPQYLKPLQKGQSLNFVVPVLVKQANAGGTITLTVQEDGRTVVIHSIDF